MNFWMMILLSCIGTMSLVFSSKITSVKHSVVDDHSHGTWKKTWQWQSKWVKTWKKKMVYVSNWTKVWTPLEISEFIPFLPVPLSSIKPPHEHNHY